MISITKIQKNTVLHTHAKSLIRNSGDIAKFKQDLKTAKNIAFLSGAGISSESGIPTFRGRGGYWRRYSAASLATPEAFNENPSLVWEFYHHRREVAAKAQPNAGHIAIAKYEAKNGQAKTITVVTQNVDGLHARAGTKNLVELHGSLFKTRCTKCNEVLVNNDNPICEALANKGAPGKDVVDSKIPIKSLPYCKKTNCNGLLRPHIVWFGESLETAVFEKADEAISKCDVCLIIGTSSLVYPAAGFGPLASARGAIVAEFNIEPTNNNFNYYFAGPSATTLPQVLND
ncbi:NAD-dependent protein deacylase sirtuin-5, mitochondrial-like [Ostrinia furnacalis]|uniref:NAD-dependent protein deacylase sirtuin-5, mitochondrial-like n=1 Tax=Ostrinia furnacalis TaxID=93504 RepID=UPI00103B706C|nr:NAD-dependent protein deacylase sirtuin-5, mitochondrial-like [Ostrinia furnacalis]